MSGKFEHEVMGDSGLTRTRWLFWLDGFTLRTKGYAAESRATKRHGWTTDVIWENVGQRRNWEGKVKLDRQPDVDWETRQAVLAKVIAAITFTETK